MGTAWTYQGRLLDDNAAADGVYDMQFKLYDDSNIATATQIGTTVDVNDIAVSEGYFIAELDFGSDPNNFKGDRRWLEIAVRPGEEMGNYTALNPLQPVTIAPYALYAASAGSDNDWTINGDEMYAAVTGNVGIGTTNPASGRKLEVQADNKIGIYTQINDSNYAAIYATNAGSGPSARFQNGNIQVVNGSIGVGTTTPTEKIDVIGTVKATAFIGDGSGLTNLPAGAETDPQVGVNSAYYVPHWDGSALVTGSIYDKSNVGIGDAAPDGKLEVNPDGIEDNGDETVFDSVGFVGIGTTNPDGRLHIVDGTSGGAPAVSGWDMIIAENDDDAYIHLITPVTKDSGILFSDGTRGSGSIIYDHTEDRMLFTSDGSTGMAYHSIGAGYGYLGIGTDAPVNALDVRKDNVTIWDGSASVDQANQEGDLFVENDLEVDGYTYLQHLDVDGEVQAENMPGCEFTDTLNTMQDIPTTWTNVRSVTLTVDAAGYIIVSFSGYARIDIAGGRLDAAIGTTSTNSNILQTCGGALNDRIPFNVQYVYQVTSAGTYTYYGNAASYLGSGATLADIYFSRMTAIYMPVRY